MYFVRWDSCSYSSGLHLIIDQPPHDENCSHHRAKKPHRADSSECRIAGFMCTITLFPVNAVLVDAPIANASHSRVSHRGATTDHLTPAAVPFGLRIYEIFTIRDCLWFIYWHTYRWIPEVLVVRPSCRRIRACETRRCCTQLQCVASCWTACRRRSYRYPSGPVATSTGSIESTCLRDHHKWVYFIMFLYTLFLIQPKLNITSTTPWFGPRVASWLLT